MFEILLGVAAIVIASKMAPAMAARMSGRVKDPDYERRFREVEERLEDVQDKVMKLSAGAHERLVEVEERIDFAERVLQQQRDVDRLEPGEPRYEH
jgi:aminoglycoside N3'-acetyltransferase